MAEQEQTQSQPEGAPEEGQATEPAGTSGTGQYVGEAGQPASPSELSSGELVAPTQEAAAVDKAEQATSEVDKVADPGSGGIGTAEDNAAPQPPEEEQG